MLIALSGCGKKAQPKMTSDFTECNGLALATAVAKFGNPSTDDVGVIDPAVYRTDKGPAGTFARRYIAAGGTDRVRVLRWEQGEYYTVVWFVQKDGAWVGYNGYRAHKGVRW